MSESAAWPRLMRHGMQNGATYAVAIVYDRRHVYELGKPPPGLRLDFEAMFDA